MATMARAGQLIGDHMATNNAVNLNKPICSFYAYRYYNDSNCTGDGTAYPIIYHHRIWDNTLDYNEATGVFVVPKKGIYRIDASVLLSNLDAAHTEGFLQLINSTSGVTYTGNIINVGAAPHGTEYSLTLSRIIQADAGDNLNTSVTVSGGTKTVEVSGYPELHLRSYFSCCRLRIN
jgi:hypothetical protein